MKKENYPVSIQLNFKNNDDKENFLASLSDGWGEGYCDLEHINKKLHHYKNKDFNVTFVYDVNEELEASFNHDD